MSAKKGSCQSEVMPWKDFISIYEKISFWLIIGFGSDKPASHYAKKDSWVWNSLTIIFVFKDKKYNKIASVSTNRGFH